MKKVWKIREIGDFISFLEAEMVFSQFFVRCKILIYCTLVFFLRFRPQIRPKTQSESVLQICKFQSIEFLKLSEGVIFRMGKISTNPKSIESRERKANQAAEAKAAKEKAKEDAFWKDDDKSKVAFFLVLLLY